MNACQDIFEESCMCQDRGKASPDFSEWRYAELSEWSGRCREA
jgi:hypothetical protein